MHITTGMIPKTPQYSIKHFNSLHIPNSQPYFCPSQNNKFSLLNYHQKLNGIQNFIKYHFFFLQQNKKFII